jgi:Gamma-glutamyltranspeptidase
MRALSFHSAGSVHLMVEAMPYAYKDRNNVLGDPAFTHNPVDELRSPAHAASIRAQIQPGKATPSQGGVLATSHEKPETTQVSVLDSDGNAVSLTYTINGFFDAGVIAGDTAFFLNDDDFTVKAGVPNLAGLVHGQTNAIAPGKRPLSSTAPTIVLRDGKVMLALGSPGGPRIITITLETLMKRLGLRHGATGGRRRTPHPPSGCRTRCLLNHLPCHLTRKGSWHRWGTKSSSSGPGVLPNSPLRGHPRRRKAIPRSRARCVRVCSRVPMTIAARPAPPSESDVQDCSHDNPHSYGNRVQSSKPTAGCDNARLPPRRSISLNTCATQSTNTRSFALRCRFGGYIT